MSKNKKFLRICIALAILLKPALALACAVPSIGSYNKSAPVAGYPTCAAQGGTSVTVVNACVGADCREIVLSCNIPVNGGGINPGSTPFLFAWTKNNFYIENDVLNTYNDRNYEVAKDGYENGAGDAFQFRKTDIYKMHLRPDVTADGIKLLIKEIEPEESDIDQARLIRVIYPKGAYAFTNMESNAIEAVAPPKDIAPRQCAEDTGRDCLKDLAAIDNLNIQASKGKELYFEFDIKGLDKNNLYLHIHSWGQLPLPVQQAPFTAKATSSLRIFIFDPAAKDQLTRVKDIHPREFAMATDTSLAEALKGFTGNKLGIKIRFTNDHVLDYVGLIESTPVKFKTEELPLLKAVHSSGQDMMKELKDSDKVYAHTVRGEQISLVFAAPQTTLKDNETDAYFFAASGFYHGLRTYLYPKVDAGDSYKKEIKDYTDQLKAAFP